MFQRLSLIALLAALPLGLAFSQIQFQEDLERPVSFAETLSFPGYDSNQGELQRVAVCYRYKHRRTIQGESEDTSPTIVTVDFVPGFVQVRQDTDMITEVPLGSATQAFALTEFDGEMDMAGSSGFSWRNTEHGFGIVFLDDPAMMQRFIDVASVDIDLEGFDLVRANGSGNLMTDAASRIRMFTEVIYFQ